MAEKNGTIVDTPLGRGQIVGRDPHFNEFRYIVKITEWKEPSWSFAGKTNPAFWPNDVSPIEEVG